MFSPDLLVLQLIPFFFIALLYSSVGHAGATGYLAVMALLSFSPEIIKPTALILNCFVATIASVKYISAGFFDKKAFTSCAFSAIPMAFVGGHIQLDSSCYKLLAGVFLLVSATLLLLKKKPNIEGCNSKKEISLPVFFIVGGLIGLFSGLIGVGGGIFLSPILILSNRICIKKVSGVVALFVLLNSMAGLAGHVSAVKIVDASIIYLIVAVAIGGFLGSYLGSTKFSRKIIICCLAIVLVNSGLKFLISAFL